MKDCKYMTGVTCNFKHETTNEDCTLCMTNVMLIHTDVMLKAICSMRLEFGHAKNILIAYKEIVDTQRGLVKLIKEAYPEAAERATIPREPPNRMAVA